MDTFKTTAVMLAVPMLVAICVVTLAGIAIILLISGGVR